MNTELRNTEAGRALYNQLRLAIAFPGETIAGVTRLYEPVNKDDWTWEMALADDTPPAYPESKCMWLLIGYSIRERKAA